MIFADVANIYVSLTRGDVHRIPCPFASFSWRTVDGVPNNDLSFSLKSGDDSHSAGETGEEDKLTLVAI